MRDQAIMEELRVLGLVLEDVRRFEDVLRHGDMLFATKEGTALYEACKECHEKRGRVVPELVQGTLRRKVGPTEAREILDLAVELATISQWDESLKILVDRAHRRRIIQAAGAILQAARNEDMRVEDLDAEAIRLVTDAVMKRDLVEAVTIGDVATKWLDDIETKKGLIKAIPIGLVELNNRLKGLRGGCLYTIGAGTGIGKTHLVIHICHFASSRGYVGLLVSLEMSRYDICQRMVARLAGPFDLAEKVDGELKDRLEDAVSKVAGLPLYICDNRYMGAQHVQSLARILQAKHGIDYLVVDYLTLLQDPTGVKEKRHAVAENVKALRALAGELNIPVIIVSQVSRNLAERRDKRPKMTDLYESAVIEQHSDAILLLHREEKYRFDAYNWCPPEIEGVMEIEVSKVRYARDGGRVYAKLDAGRSILRDMNTQEIREYLKALKSEDDHEEQAAGA